MAISTITTNSLNPSGVSPNLTTWTTATRPSSPATGRIGFNTTLGVVEAYNGSAWVSGGGLNQQAVQTTGFTATAGNSYPCNTTSAAFTVTLPASPVAGNQVGIIDYAGTFATNNVTLGRNGSNIIGVASNYVLTTNRESVILTYIDSTQGWVVSSAAYTTSPISLPTYTASYLVVAGGGGGGGNGWTTSGGGGGAGGYVTGTISLSVGTVYTATVGAGGSGGAGQGSPGNVPAAGGLGSNSSFPGVTTAVGGGGGISQQAGTLSPAINGGSGGGGNYSTAAGSGTPGQGNAGGTGSTTSPGYGGGGGGGSGAVGGNGAGPAGGNGGAGTANSITGTPTTYTGGGGGGAVTTVGVGGSNPAQVGGSPGGGASGGLGPATGSAATANTGGGGGGGGPGGTPSGGNGGSGVVILSVPTANYSGTTTGSPTISTSGSNTIIKWTTVGSGTYTA